MLQRQMEPTRVAELQPQVQAILRAALTPDIDAVFIGLGRAYLPALGAVPDGPWKVVYAQGCIGRRLCAVAGAARIQEIAMRECYNCFSSYDL